MNPTTLLFLVRKDPAGRITEILLAMKKRRFGTGKWNGVGGKVEAGESLEDALLRETYEEVSVRPRALAKVGELAFTFPHKPEFDQIVHVYLTTQWDGVPLESEEMKPQWFKVADIPFSTMWSDDPLWLPHVLEGKCVRGSFTFREDEGVQDHLLEVLETL